MRGYFRTYQSYNGEPKYFSDGIIDYYIPKKGGNITYKLAEYRVFGNKKLIQSQKLSSTFYNEPPRVPDLRFENIINGKKVSYILKNISETEIHIQKGNAVVGYIKKNTKQGITEIFVDNLAPDSVSSKKILWLTANITKSDELEVYNTDKPEFYTKENLVALYKNNVGEYRTKKKADYKKAEFLSEFFVVSKSYLNKDEFGHIKERKSSIFMDEKSSFTSPYWENLDNWNIPFLNKGIQNSLKGDLELY
ncbi:MAG: hypothetical protein EOP00_32100 [Pedobacter sp.]|nr:MAG: hypothetical protein EOP00_32100 [Pedobacter sp.]